MSTHISANDGDIADAVLLPGDPLRAKFIAKTFFENPVCYSEVRGMYGFTGTYRGKRVSVQGTGMGQPSISIYASELFQYYGVQKAIRVGTCGAVNESTPLRAVILASGACSDSAINAQRFSGRHYAPVADFSLLKTAWEAANARAVPVQAGLVASTDLFYDETESWKLWRDYGVLGIEMEAAELYTLAAKLKRRALAILTVSDNLATGEATSAEQRQTSFTSMIEIALETLIQN